MKPLFSQDITWRSNQNGKLFLSCSKDASLWQHSWKDAWQPDQFYSKIGMDLCPSGEIAVASKRPTDAISIDLMLQMRAVSDDIVRANSKEMSGSSWGIFGAGRRGAQPEPPAAAMSQSSALFVFAECESEKVRPHTTFILIQESALQLLSMDWFVETAKRSRMTGRCTDEICEHNAKVATELDRVQVYIEAEISLVAIC